MFIRKASIIFLGSLFIGLIGCTKNTQNENTSEISKYLENKLKFENIKPLFTLKNTDEERYNIIIENLPEDYNENDYYYSISKSYKNTSDILYEINITKQKYKTEGYEIISNNFIDREIKFEEYAIWYYKIFLEEGFGDPTGKCFTAYFNNEYGFIGKSAWE